jgi:hypothetical protein
MNDLDLITGLRPEMPLAGPDQLAHARGRVMAAVAAESRAARTARQILSSGSPAARPHPVSRPRRSLGARRSFRLATGAVVTAAAAATVLAGVGTFTGAGPAARQAGRPAGQHPVVINARTLADRVSTALSAARRNAVLYTRTSCACGITAVTREWDYGISTREQWLGSRGALNFDGSAEVSHGLRVRRFVDYTTRTWQKESSPAATYGAPPAFDSPRAIRALIASYPWPPQFGSMITTTLNGRKVVKITRRFVNWSPGYPLPLRTIGGFEIGEFPVSMPAATPKATSQTVWYDAATYLPVQEAQTASSGQNIVVSTYTWLPLTPANLAKVRTPAPVPAGFTQTQLPGH